MKLRKFGRAFVATAVGVGFSFGLTSCVQSHTIGYFFVTGAQYNQVTSYKIDNNTGNLTQVGQPIGTGGTNPVDALVVNGGRFLYVLNAGCSASASAKYPCASGQSPTPSSISLFSIGGGGVLTFEQNYSSPGQTGFGGLFGQNAVAMATNTGGNILYVLNQNVPSPVTLANSETCGVPAAYQNAGAVSVFSLDSNTGRPSVIVNQQVTCTDNSTALPFFPVGVAPIWFTVYSNYLYTLDRGPSASPATTPSYVTEYSAPSSGQLVSTQNTEFATGGIDPTYIYGSGSYLYVLDAGLPSNANSSLYNGQILTYTSGSNGALVPITGGAQTQSALGYVTAVNPQVMLVDKTNKFLYVANELNTAPNEPASLISGYNILTGGILSQVFGNENGAVNSGTGSGPKCILEDPSNQFLYTANHDGSISGFILNTENGTLSGLRIKRALTGPGEPTWCVASGTTF